MMRRETGGIVSVVLGNIYSKQTLSVLGDYKFSICRFGEQNIPSLIVSNSCNHNFFRRYIQVYVKLTLTEYYCGYKQRFLPFLQKAPSSQLSKDPQTHLRLPAIPLCFYMLTLVLPSGLPPRHRHKTSRIDCTAIF